MLTRLALATALTLAALATVSHADVVTVQATANIYSAGHNAVPGNDGSLAGFVSVFDGNILTITSIGSITYNGGNYNDPDGFGSVSNENVSSLNGLSGISSQHAGVLVGVFVSTAEPGDPAPALLSYSDANTDFTSVSPLLNQVFYIGDGLTSDGTGSVQMFVAPAGAVKLYLGFADAPGYNGAPGSYGDNYGTFTTTVSGNTVPEPASLGLLAIAAPLLMKRRR